MGTEGATPPDGGRRAGSSTIAAILFTDLVGSTELLAELGDRADEVRRALFTALRDVVASAGGEEVKSLGDGLMVAFPSAVGAVSGAVAIQQTVARLDRREHARSLQIRVGISVGEVSCEDGDYFGAPVVEAARLCATAAGSQVLVSDLVATLAGTRSPYAFHSVGTLELKGLPRPLAALEVAWEATGPEIALPSALALSNRGAFVGRDAAAQVIAGALADAEGGERHMVLVAGEPGIGKTRLVASVAAAAQARGVTVLYGRCDPELGVPYQPFAQALRQYVLQCPIETLRSHLAVRGGELGRLVPELSRRLPDAPQPVLGEPEGDRLRLFEAVDGLLVDASADAPVLLVIDDLHWAAKPTLLLLAHLARSSEPAPLSVVATFRDTETDAELLTAALGDLHRQHNVRRLQLLGLDQEAVAALVAASAGGDLGAASVELARVLHAETQGNPFFVGELLRHLLETGALADGLDALAQPQVPDTVKEVMRARLSRLAPPTRRVLEVAAVVGGDFRLALLERIPDAGSPAEVVDGLDEAVRARLVLELDPATCQYSFAHSLVRATIEGGLTSARRALLHRRVGEALEGLAAGDRPGGAGARGRRADVAALAHHFRAAVPTGQADKAADYALAAAAQSLEQVAYEEAAEVLTLALEALDGAERTDPARRCDLLLTLAETRVRSLDPAGVRDACLRAAEAAREAGSPERLARAAYWYSARTVAGTRDDVGIALCEEALAALGPDAPPAQRAAALAVLALHQSFAADNKAAHAASDEALALAGQSGDEEALALALFARYYTLWGSERAADQAAAAEVLLSSQVVMPTGWVASIDAHRLLTVPRLVLGDFGGFVEGTETVERIGRRLKSRYFLGLVALWKGCRALLEGRFDDVDSVAAESGVVIDDPNLGNAFAGQLFQLSFERGTLGALGPLIGDFIDRNPGLAGFRAGMALSHLEAGQLDDGRRVFEALAADRFAAVPRDLIWTAAMAILCEVCAELGDGPRAQVLHELFLPYRGQLVVVASGAYCPGAVDRYLGMTAMVAGRLDEAEALLGSALALEASIGAVPLAARTRYWYARLLGARGAPGDRERRWGLLMEALQAATALGMPGLATRIEVDRAGE